MRDDDAGTPVANDRTTAVAEQRGIYPRGDGYLLAPVREFAPLLVCPSVVSPLASCGTRLLRPACKQLE